MEPDTTFRLISKKDVVHILTNGSVSKEARCKYCSTLLLSANGGSIQYYCTLCGYARGGSFWAAGEESLFRVKSETILRNFPLNSPKVTLEELGMYFRENYESISNLSPRRCELLVADIFRNQGYKVELTKQTRDGGYDLILLTDGKHPIIVEVKRCKGRVGVDVIRELLGVQLLNDCKNAKLVTTGRFTNIAKLEVLKIPEKYEFKIELHDAEDLLRFLDIYKDNVSLAANVEMKLKQLKKKE